MITWTIQAIAAILLLAIGSYTDLRTSEVPDWVSHGFIYLGFALNLVLTIVFMDIWFIVASVIGFALCFALGYAMYKLGQWGGGDTKVIMAIGSIVGFNFGDFLLLTFLINTILVGAAYGIIWSLIVAFRNWKNFTQTYLNYTKSKPIIKIRIGLYAFVVFAIVASLFIAPIFRIEIFSIAAIIFFLVHLWIIIKVVEKSCMIQEVNPSKLTEGDWIVEDVVVKGKKITGPKDLGIEKSQIAELKKLGVKKVKVKYGIPFVPSFLIAFILALIVGAWYLGFFKMLGT